MHKCAGCGKQKPCHAIVRFPTNPGTELGYCADCWSTMFCSLIRICIQCGKHAESVSCEDFEKFSGLFNKAQGQVITIKQPPRYVK